MCRWQSIVFGFMFLAIFALGFSILDEMFKGYVSPGLAFVLTAAATMMIFVILGFLFGPRKASMPTDDNKDKTHPVLAVVLFPVAIVGAASWSALAYIETNALSQPDHAIGAFTVAVRLKGVMRYMTPEQHTIDQIASWTFFGCVLVPLGGFLVDRAWRRLRDDGS
jgi:uncharacterized membrane protein